MRRFHDLLVYVEPDAGAKHALERVADLAADTGARVTLAASREELPRLARLVLDDPRRTEEMLAAAMRSRLAAQAEPLRARGIDVDTALLSGRPHQALVGRIVEEGHDLLVMDFCHPVGRVRRALLGSTELRLLRECPVPVWMVKPHTPASGNRPRYLAAVDPFVDDDVGRDLNTRILEVTEGLAARAGGEAHAAYAWTLPSEDVLRNRIRRDELEALLEDARDRASEALAETVGTDGAWERHLVKGYAWEVIPELVRELDVDVLVMGSVVRTGIAGALIGNTAENLLQAVDCSLLVLKPRGFTSSLAPKAH